MSLDRKSFETLNSLRRAPGASQREIADGTGLSLGSVNAAMQELTSSGLLADGVPTAEGLKALSPYKVDNAIILAAGLQAELRLFPTRSPRACCGCAVTC